MKPAGWEVTAEKGFTSLHKERAAADRYAVACHGTVDALYRGADVEAAIAIAVAAVQYSNRGRDGGPPTRKEPTMGVRAKFTLSEITLMQGTMRRLKFTAQYDSSIPEDQRFQKATPWGEFCMNVDNPAALAQFELGKAYYFDATPAEPAPAA